MQQAAFDEGSCKNQARSRAARTTLPHGGGSSSVNESGPAKQSYINRV